MKASVNKIVISTLTAAFLVGCGGGGSSSSSTATTSATGGAQKGPFKAGQTVTAQKLLNTGANDTSVSAITTTTDSLGKFQFSTISWSGPTEFKVEGEYLDESTGQYVPGGLLTAVTNVEAGTAPKVNINILTHIAASNIKEQMANNVSIDEAKQKAKEVVSKVFKIDLSNTQLESLDLTNENNDSASDEEKAANTKLLKLSAALSETTNPEETLIKLAEDLKDDEGDGEIDGDAEAIFEELKEKEAEVKLEDVAQKMKAVIHIDTIPDNEDNLAGTMSLNNNIKFTDVYDATQSESITKTATVSGIITNSTITSADISISDSATFLINGVTDNKISNNDVLTIQTTASADYDGEVKVVVTIGGVDFDFKVKTMAEPQANDTKIKQIFLDFAKGVTPSSSITSAVARIEGITDTTTVSIDNGTLEVSTDETTWATNTSGTVSNGDYIRVIHTSSSSFSSSATSKLTFGAGDSAIEVIFKSYTKIEDETPDNGTFSDVIDSPIYDKTDSTTEYIISSPITIAGLDDKVDLELILTDNDTTEYSLDGITWSTTKLTDEIKNDDKIYLRHKAPTTNSTKTTSRLVVGKKIFEFNSYTQASTTVVDTTPNEFKFTALFDQETETVVESNSITISGVSEDTDIDIKVSENAEYSINDTWYSEDSVVKKGDVVKIRHKTTDKNLEKTESTLTIGGVSSKFVTYTKAPADKTPNFIVFETLESQDTSAEVTSEVKYIRGINTSIDITITEGSTFSINEGDFVTSGTVNDGDKIQIKHTTSSSNKAEIKSELKDSDGKVIAVFKSITKELAPVFDTKTLPATEVNSGSLYSFTPSATNAKEFEIENKPSWASFNYRTGQLTGTPNKKEYEKTYENIIIKAENDGGEVELTPFSITVNNIAPTIALDTMVINTTIHNTNDIKITASSVDTQGETFTYELIDAPSFVSISDNIVTISPSTEILENKKFSVKVTDKDGLSAQSEVTLNVIEYSDVKTPPSISGKPNSSVNEDETYSFTPNASDINSNELTFKITNKPSWATFSETTGLLSGTPTNDDVGIYENIIIEVTEAGDTVSLDAFSIEVVNTNDAPTTSNSSVVLNNTTQSSVSGSLVANDIDVGDVLTYEVVQTPNYGTVEIDQNGQFTYTLTNLQYLGSDSFSFKVNDKTVDSNVSSVSINITDGSVSLNSDVDNAIKILESIDPEIENIDTKLTSAKDLLNGNTTAEAKIISLMIQTAEIINDPDIASLMLVENDSSLDDTSMLNKVVRDMATNLVNLDIVNNPTGISSTLTSKFNKVADNLKNISNEFGNLFVSSSDSYSYNGDSMNYNDSLALRAGILSLASQLKNLSAYKWGEDKDFSVKTYTQGSDTYEYLELDVNPAKFLNEGNFFALDSNNASTRLQEVKQNLIDASNLLLNLPVGYEEITQEDLDEVNAINLALRGVATYKINFEDDEEIKEVEIDLSKMFDVNYAIDISSFGSSWQNLCNNESSVMISAEEAMKNGYLECKSTYTYYDGYNTYSHYYYSGADVEPQVLATSADSSIDDIVKTITKVDNTVLTGQAIIDFIAENQGIEAFNTNFINVKSDERYLVSGNNASYNQYLDSIAMRAYKSNGADSRAEVKNRFSVAKSEVSSNVELVNTDSQKDLTNGAVGRSSVITHMENINTNGDNLYARVSFEVDAIKYYISKYDSSWENEELLYKGIIISGITTINEEAMFYMGEPKFNVRITVDENDVIFNVARLSAKAVVETYNKVVKTIEGSNDLGIDAVRFNSEVRLSNFDETAYNNVNNPTIFRVYSLDTINLQKMETFSFSQLTSDKFIAVGDDYYDIINYANNKFTFEMYEYDYETDSYVKQDESGEISVAPSSTNDKVANYVDASSGEEGVLTLVKTIKLDGYDDLYKTIGSLEVTKQGNIEDWYRWDWVNPTYWDGSVSNAIVNADGLEIIFTAQEPNWTYSDKYNEVMLNSNGDVVQAIQDGFRENSNEPKYIRTETKVGQWTKDSVNNQLVLTLDKEIIKIRVVQDGSDYFIENSNTLQVGFIFEEHFISGNSLDSFMEEQF